MATRISKTCQSGRERRHDHLRAQFPGLRSQRTIFAQQQPHFPTRLSSPDTGQQIPKTDLRASHLTAGIQVKDSHPAAASLPGARIYSALAKRSTNEGNTNLVNSRQFPSSFSPVPPWIDVTSLIRL